MDISIYKAFLTALFISIICTPILIKFSRKKGFYASINHRSSHDASVPNTGGIILCFAILVPVIIFSDYLGKEDFSLLVSAFAVLLITGIIDDFNPMPVAFKFLGQFIPAIVIVTAINEQELVFPFIGEIVQLPFIFNYLFWIFFIIMSINAFNLIDGVDGLAIGLGIVSSFYYFLNFLMLGEYDLSIFAISICSSLLGLLYFNISKKYKIFIGDTGSLLIGGILVYFALKFMSLSV
jgi:UDP-GlcNAc:undecaprenyl-phosphate GlcNAc-1-phosphate transferase